MKQIPLVLCSLILSAPTLVQAAGPLSPPGAPAPTMKTLDEVEARIPISSAFNISAPGSYYLTQNLVGAGNSFRIAASNVTLDLNGFSVEGTSAGNGIWVVSGTNKLHNVTIKNGTIAGFGRGVQLQHVVDSEVSDLKIRNCSGAGINLFSNSAENSGNVIRRCILRDCEWGIVAGGGICHGNRFEDCTIAGMSFDGIVLGEGGGTTTGNRILRCDLSDINQNGIEVLASVATSVISGNEIRDCVVSGANDRGIALEAAAAGALCDGNVVQDCVISGTRDEGIKLSAVVGASCDGNVVRSCTVRDTTGSGIRAEDTTYCRIEGNHVSQVGSGVGGSHGLFVSGAKNFVVRNTCGAATDNIDIGAANVFGPEVNTSGALGNTGDASHPLANFNLL